MPFVYLTDLDVARARACAERRQAANSDPNRPNRNADTDPDRNWHWEYRGALAELACAIHLKADWTGEYDRTHDIAGGIEVRATHPTYRLAVVAKDFATHDLDTPFVSATWDGQHDPVGINLRGWATLRDARNYGTRREKDGHIFYLVESQDLRPMSRLEAQL